MCDDEPKVHLYWVLPVGDKGPAFGPILDERYARQYAKATDGILVSVPATSEAV
jgi:hypothetical protein